MQRKYSKRKKRSVGKSKKAALTIVLLQSDWDIQKEEENIENKQAVDLKLYLKRLLM